ncbi:hypothetical protein [Streptomyces sp. NPDC058595]
MNLIPFYDFLIHDVLGNLTASALTALVGYGVSRIKRRTVRPPGQGQPPE